MSKGMVVLQLVFAGIIVAPVASAAVRERSTSIAHARPDGKVLVLATGTEDGECSIIAGRMTCHDGRSYAIADTDGGCRRVSAGARCMIENPEERRGGDDSWGQDLVTTQDTQIDIECETGSKQGGVYTIRDGDSTGSCGRDYAVGGKTSGGTCTKNGRECASIDCDRGCAGASNGCQCGVKSGPKKVITVNQ